MRIGWGALRGVAVGVADAVRWMVEGRAGAGAAGKAGFPFEPGISTEADIVRRLGAPAGLALAAQRRSLSYTGILDPATGTFTPVAGAFCLPAGHGLSTVVLHVGAGGVLESVTFRQWRAHATGACMARNDAAS